MERDLAQNKVKQARKARRDSPEPARSGVEPGAPLSVQPRLLLSLQSSAGNRAAAGLGQRWIEVNDPVAVRPDAARSMSVTGRLAQSSRIAQRKVTLTTGTKRKKTKKTLDVQGLIDTLDKATPANRLGPVERSNHEGLQNFLDNGPDVDLDEEDEDYQGALDNLAVEVKRYLRPPNPAPPAAIGAVTHEEAKRQKAAAKNPELAELQAEFDKSVAERNLKLQPEKKKDTTSGANDAHMALSQQLIGQARAEVAEEFLTRGGLPKGGEEWLKTQKEHGLRKAQQRGETHHMGRQ